MRRAACQVPLAPRRDHLDVRLQRVIAEFEAHLIVALAGRAVRDRIGADYLGDLDLLLGDERARDRGTQQILALVERVGTEHRKDIVADEFLAQILDEDILRLHAQHLGLAPRRLDLLALAQVSREGHNLRVIFGLQPFQDDRGVEPTRISEHHFQLLVGHS